MELEHGLRPELNFSLYLRIPFVIQKSSALS
jgi:hypothetical protein